MKHSLTRLQSRLLAALLLVAALALLYGIALEPLRLLYASNDQSIEDLSRRLEHYRLLAGQKADLEARIRHVTSARRLDKYYLSKETDALAAAELQALISEVVTRANGSLISTQPLPTQAKELLPKVRVRVRMTGDLAVVRNTLHELESGTPFLVLEEVSILSRGGRALHRAANSVAYQLSVQFDVSGYMRLSPDE